MPSCNREKIEKLSKLRNPQSNMDCRIDQPPKKLLITNVLKIAFFLELSSEDIGSRALQIGTCRNLRFFSITVTHTREGK